VSVCWGRCGWRTWLELVVGGGRKRRVRVCSRFQIELIAIFCVIFYGLMCVRTVLIGFYCLYSLGRISPLLSVAYMRTVKLLN